MDALALLAYYTNSRIRSEGCSGTIKMICPWRWLLISWFRSPRCLLLKLCAELGPMLERPAQRNSTNPTIIILQNRDRTETRVITVLVIAPQLILTKMSCYVATVCKTVGCVIKLAHIYLPPSYNTHTQYTNIKTYK